jgi:hypothetical protein
VTLREHPGVRSSSIAVGLALVACVTTGCHRKHKGAKSPDATKGGETAVADQPPASGATDDPGNGTCGGMPVFESSFDAFSVAKPKGWLLGYNTGTIFIRKDATGREGVVIVPARLRQDVPPEKFLEIFAQGLDGSIRKSGGTFGISKVDHDAKHAHAEAKAIVQGVQLEGPITVEKEPGFATLKLYFAPSSDFADEKPTLEKIAGCFHRKTTVLAHGAAPAGAAPPPAGAGKTNAIAPQAGPPSAMLKVHQGKAVRIALPTDWKVTDDGANGIDTIANDSAATVSFGFVTGMVGPRTPVQFAQQMTSKFLAGAHTIATTALPPPGPGWSSVAIEFDGKIANASVPVHGVVTSSVFNSAGSSSGVVATRYATAATWESKKLLLQSIAQSIQITKIVSSAPRNVIPRGSPSDSPAVASGGGSSTFDEQNQSFAERWAAQDKQSAAFQQYQMDWDPVHDSNGEHYNVPTNAYSSTGPQGAGYYMDKGNGTVEKLESDSP